MRKEFPPRDDKAKEYEHRAIENYIDDSRKWKLFRLLCKPAIVCETYSGSEGNKEIITAWRGSNAYREWREGGKRRRTTVSQCTPSFIGEPEQSVSAVTDYETRSNAGCALLENSDKKSFFDRFSHTRVFQGYKLNVEKWKGNVIVACWFSGE